jgi:hypothetical protein
MKDIEETVTSDKPAPITVSGRKWDKVPWRRLFYIEGEILLELTHGLDEEGVILV